MFIVILTIVGDWGNQRAPLSRTDCCWWCFVWFFFVGGGALAVARWTGGAGWTAGATATTHSHHLSSLPRPAPPQAEDDKELQNTR